MTPQEIEACLTFIGRTTLNAQEIPAWNAVVSRLQEMLKAAREQNGVGLASGAKEASNGAAAGH